VGAYVGGIFDVCTRLCDYLVAIQVGAIPFNA
jgi:hypothetical protein